MITHRFVDLLPSGAIAGPGRRTLQRGKCSLERHGEAAHPLAVESSLPRVDGSAWGWLRLACCLVVVLGIASAAYLYIQGAVAFYRAFNQPISLGSEWEALASVNRAIPSSPFNPNYP